ncbi:nitrilase-related carbon-nitrogen hydrolase [Alterisphingorhabdus coralli]|uniref:Nitrilase-related carbon-nitrogen hydrolase n=1 Tax=Alterisphingorhabdus coralli TaxID=3071408 RepID=A0AA97F711_9SPHN|nr:nitrilase-related carbon-nitrogen hydrolase [Parasphingorhabdus sp. SCSIO 66989]WOE75371.1 nitrilase-related carbon-nitrogen hydrolase [Parasphingorhabdus sp. SCSIO 66989]
MTATPVYAAVAMQLAARSIENTPDRTAAREQMLVMIAELEGKIRSSAIFIEQYAGSKVRLAVLPEYLLTSYPGRISIGDFADKAALEIDGPEYAALGALAERLNMFIAGNAYEVDAHFPGLYFQACFIIAPSGEVVLRYRRLNSMFAPTPHDVWSKYLDIYGIDGVFPVARTEIGNLAAIASEEILYPEIARALALRGAEIFAHSSSEIGSPLDTPKDIAKRARAQENMAYVVSANTAGITNTSLPLASADGNSMVADFKGRVLAESNSGETFTAFADIDLNALRTARRKPAMTNFLARQRLELFADVYQQESPQKADSLIQNNEIIVPDRDYFLRIQEQTIERLIKDGLI